MCFSPLHFLLPFSFLTPSSTGKFNQKRQFTLRKSLRSHKEYKLYLMHIKYFKIFNMTQSLQKEHILVTIMQQNETWIVIVDPQFGYCLILGKLFTVSKLLSLICIIVITILIVSGYYSNQWPEVHNKYSGNCIC